MFISNCLDVNEHGHLTIDGADTVALAQQYGTPVYCMSENELRAACRGFKSALSEFFGDDSMVLYASKALSCKEIYRIVMDEGLGIDVVSGGELFTALSVGFPADKVFFHGNNKTTQEMAYAMESGVGYIVIDSMYELETLGAIAKSCGKTQNVLLRIKPGVEAHIHQFVLVGSIDSKFGFAAHNGEALEAVDKLSEYPNLVYKGLHCHIGSQIFEIEPFAETARVMLDFIGNVKQSYGIDTPILNLGGGFGIKYTPQNVPCALKDVLGAVAAVVDEECAKLNIPRPFIAIEPGRAIAAPAGITLYTVGAVKDIKDVRTYVSVDGGMTDNPRYSLYGSEYTAVIANKADKAADFKVTIAGRCCETDLLQENTYIQKPDPGDIMAMLSTGAYNYAMASNYNRLPKPPIVMVKDGESRVVVKRETYDDLIRHDV